MGWTFTLLDKRVERELTRLSVDVRARLDRIAELVRSYGLDRLPDSYVKHVEGRIWEFRLTGKDGIARALYVTAVERRVVVLHVFVKKTQKLPLRHLQVARDRARDVQ